MQSYTFDFIPPSTNAMYRCYRNRICKSARLKMFEQQILTYFDDFEKDIIMIEGKLNLTNIKQKKGLPHAFLNILSFF